MHGNTRNSELQLTEDEVLTNQGGGLGLGKIERGNGVKVSVEQIGA